MLALLGMGARLKRIAPNRAGPMSMSISCADSANIAMLAERLWRAQLQPDPARPDAGRLRPEPAPEVAPCPLRHHHLEPAGGVVDRELAGDKPEIINIAPMGVDLEQIRRQQHPGAPGGGGPPLQPRAAERRQGP